jgi:endonuclease YncB( thermonuclease family)
MQTKDALILALLITILVANNFLFFSLFNKQEKETVKVTRVIDGDTLEIEGGIKVRLLNINSPEKGERGYDEAKNFLSQLENKTIEIDQIATDKYGRTLARLYVPEYINLEIVKQGHATKFLVEEKETGEFARAEELAIRTEKGIWKKSKYFSCVDSTLDPQKEIVLLKNNCRVINIENWKVVDESRKEYIFPERSFSELNLHTFKGSDNETDLFWQRSDNVWNNDRDTLYLFDEKNDIIHFESYGY